MYSNETTHRPAEPRYPLMNRSVFEVPVFFTFTARQRGERRQCAISDGWLAVTFLLQLPGGI